MQSIVGGKSFSLACSVQNRQQQAKKRNIDISYIWGKSSKKEHEYLKRKQISLGNARVNEYKGRRSLVVPLVDSFSADTKIKSLQFIQEDGEKYFAKDYQRYEYFYVASKYDTQKDRIIICEGYATAQSLTMDTESFVIAAMSADNLVNVAKRVREISPDSQIVIALDNDEPGVKAAERTCTALNGRVKLLNPQPYNDFNDLMCAEELQFLKARLEHLHDQ